MILNYDPGKSLFNEKNFMSGVVGFVKNLKPKVSKELRGLFTEENMHRDLGELIETEGIDINAKGYEELKRFADEQGNIAFGAYECEEALNNLSNGIGKVGSSFLTLKKFGANALSVLGNMATVMIAVKGFELLATSVYNYATREKRWISQGKEAIQNIQERTDAYSKMKDTIDNLNTDEYWDLKEQSDNGDLSTEEYEKFVEINNQLAEMFPTLVSGYDDQGNALIDLGESAEDASSQLQMLLNQERELAAFEVSDDLQKALKGVATRSNQIYKDIAKQDTVIGSLEPVKDALQNAKEIGMELGDFTPEVDINDHEMQNKMSQVADAYYNALVQSGIDVQDAYKAEETRNEKGDVVIQYHVRPVIDDSVTRDQIDEATGKFMSYLKESGLDDSVTEEYKNALMMKSTDLKELKAEWNSVTPSLISQLSLYDEFENIGSELQQRIRDGITGMDLSLLSDAEQESLIDDPRLFIRKAFLDPISDTLLDSNGEIIESKEKLFNQLLEFDGSKMTNEVYKKSVNDIVNQITDDKEMRKQIKVILGFQYEDEDGNHWDITKRRNDLFEAFGGEVESRMNRKNNISWKKFKTLTQEDFDAIDYARENMEVDFGTIKSWEQLTDVIQKAKDKMAEIPEVEKDGTLSSIFSDENYQSAAEGYEKKLTSLTSALETLRTEGSLTAEQMRDLQEEFPDMTDFSKEAISDNAMNVLGKWIGEFKDGLDTLSPEGLKQLRTYVDNLTASFGDLNITEKEAKDSIFSSLIDPNALGGTTNQIAAAEERFQEFKDKLSDMYGEENINWQIVWELAMEDRFSDPAADIYGEYSDRELQWQIKVDYDQTKKDIENSLADISSERSLAEARGSKNEAMGLMPGNDDDILALDDRDIEAYADAVANTYEARLQAAQSRLNEANEDFAEANAVRDSHAAQDAANRAVRAQAEVDYIKDNKDEIDRENIDAQANLVNSETKRIQDFITSQEAPINTLSNSLEKLQDDASKTQNEISKLENDGLVGTREQYNTLIQNAEAQLTNLSSQKQMWSEIADNRKDMFGEDSTLYLNALQKVTDAESQMIELRKNQQEWTLQPYINELTNTQNEYVDLQTKAANTEDLLNAADAKHQKTSKSLYDFLINNGNEQIDNLKQQRKELENIQKNVKSGSTTWRDYQSQIDEVDRSIEQMQLNQLGWAETAQSLISTNASELSSVLSSAMSEMNSETGLTIDTMNELKRQFSDLAGYDVSNIFYQSADGMKFNTEAAEALVDAEYELQTNALYDTIAQQKSIMEQYGDSTTDAAQKAVSAAEQRIGAAERELSMLQALYNQQKESLTQYQAWQNAQQTENAGAHYEGLQGYLETATKAYDQGMTGTDDFREYVRYFDEWGEDTVSAYERNIEKMKRYLTDDYQGVKNFYDDLVKNGFGTHENGIYDINMPSVEEAAHTMGMSQEWLRDMMSRGEDYGFTNDWVSSELEGRLKIKDATQKMIDEQLRYNQAERDGAGEEILKEASDNINTYSNSIHNLSGNIDDVVAREGKISAKQIQNAVSDIESLTGMIDQVKSDQSQGLISDSYAQDQIDLINQNIKSYAQDHHIPFMLDIDGNVVIDKDTLDSQFEGWEEEIKVTPVLPTNEDIMGLELTGDTQTDSVIQGLQTTLDTANGLDEEMTNLFGTIQGYSGEDLDEVVFGDKQYQNKELETALDGVLNKLGLGQEYGNALVGVLKEVLSLDEQTQGKMYDYGSEQYNESTGTRVTNLQGELKSESIPVDIDFDASIMKADELKSKLEELKNVQKQNMNQSFLSDEASNELNTLISSTQKQYKIQLGVEAIQGQGITLDQFLRLSQEEQKQILVDVNMNDDEYEQFVASVEGQTIKAQIEAQIASGSTSIQELNSLTGDELQDKIVELGIDVTGLEDAQELESIISTISSESTEVNVRIADDQMATLTSGDVEVGANTDAAEKAIDAIEKRADNAEGEMTVKANTDPATSAVNSAVSYINSQNPIIHVDADASSLNSTIEMVLAPTRTITVHANVTGLPGGGGGTVGVDGVNNNGFAFASGTEDDKVIPVAHNNDTLVGEEGYEIHVDRDRRSWSVIGQNGPEFRDDIEPGDIVFNHAQSVRLLKNGHTNTRGKALAGGQQQISGLSRLNPVNTMLADSGGSSTDSTNRDRWNKEGSQALSELTTAAKDATAATQANTGAKNDEKEATENTVSALDKFNAWLSSLFDWIEVRIERLTHKMELAISKSENIGGVGGSGGYQQKNALIDEAMGYNNKLQNTNTRAVPIYEAQATKVAKRAQKAGLITKKQRKNLVRKIKNGAMSIQEFDAELKKNKKGEETSKSESKRKTFVDAYKQWYDKARQCEAAIQDCIAKTKELEQTKLDNIVEEFESLANYSKSISQTSQAIVSLSESRGDTANSKGTMQQYANQIALEKQVQGYYNAEMKAYWAEMQNAAKVFGVDSNEYRSAQEAYEGMATALKESEKNAIDLKRALLDLNLKPMEYALNRLKAVGDRLSDVVSLKNARGTMRGQPSSAITTDDYMAQIKNANDQRVQLEERAEYNRRMLDIMNYAKGTAKWDELGGSEKWDELQTAIEQDEAAIRQMEISNEDLKKSIRTLRWKKFTDLQKILTDTISDFDHLKGLFNQEEFFDDDGEGWGITDQGYANIALIGAEYSTAINQIADYRKALEKLDEEVENHVISEEEYNETSREYVETIQKLVENTENYKDALIDMYKTQIQNENNAIQKNIDLRKEALAQQKAYYDYQKRVTEQTKQRNKVLSQLNSLEGVSNRQAKAQAARLREQLSQTDEELNDTKKNHRYDMLSQGYDKLSQDIQETLDQTLRHIQANSDEQDKIVAMMLNQVADHYNEAYDAIQQRIRETGTVVSEQTQATLNDPNLAQFFDTVDQNTLVPIDNWNKFTDAVTQAIDTSAIEMFATTSGEMLDTLTEKAKAYAKELANAANAQSNQGSTAGTGAPGSESSGGTQSVAQQKQSLQSQIANLEKQRQELKKEADKNLAYYENRTKRMNNNKKGSDAYKKNQLAAEKHKNNASKALMQVSQIEAQIEDLQRKLDSLPSYRTGTKRTLEDELALTHNKEIILGNGAILRQLPQGSQVLPKVQADNIWQWSKINPMDGLTGNIPTANITTNNMGTNYYYGSLIQVNGNVDSNMLDQINDIAEGLLKDRNFMQKQFDYNTQNFKRAYNKRA